MKRTMNLLDARTLAKSTSTRGPLANLTNAAHLMGDPMEEGDGPYGDAPYGDPSFQGDMEQASAALATYDTLIGDMFEVGGFNPGKMWRKLPKMGKIAIGGAAALGAGFSTFKIAQAIQKSIKRNQEQKRLNNAYRKSLRSNTTYNQIYARQNLPKISPSQLTSFYQVSGSSVSNYPIPGTKVFPFKQLTWTLDQQANTTPFVANIVNATQPGGAGTDYIIDIAGPAAGAYYPCVFIVIGGNMLQTAPGINYNITATMPLVGGGTLSIAAEPFTLTFGNSFYTKFCLFPWTIVATEPVYTSGFYSAANHINIHVSGSLPNAAVSAVVPGTMHPWTKGMRNSGI